MDRTPGTAEMEGALAVLRAVADVEWGEGYQVTLLIDNFNVVRNLDKLQDRAIEGEEKPHRTDYQSETWRELLGLFRKLVKAKLVVEIVWIP